MTGRVPQTYQKPDMRDVAPRVKPLTAQQRVIGNLAVSAVRHFDTMGDKRHGTSICDPVGFVSSHFWIMRSLR